MEVSVLTETIRTTNSIDFIIDADDHAYLSRFSWNASLVGNHWRATTKINGNSVYMHRLILGLDRFDGKSVDHINGNAQDNRRANLRVCTHAENRRNSAININNRSGYRGVSMTRQGRWRARIKTNYEEFWLGVFDTPEEAALVYNASAIEQHGQFARLNRLGGIRGTDT